MNKMFAPLSSSYLGFDRLFDTIDSVLSGASQVSNFPPINIFKDENGYMIELALAGFKKSQITVEHDKKNGVLTISGDSTGGAKVGDELKESMGREVVRQSIAARSFKRSFTIADDLEVESANLEDGLLTIRLKQLELPENKPLMITVN